MTQNLAEERMQLAREALMGAYPPPPGAEPGGLPLRKLLGALFRSRLFLVSTMALGVLIGGFLAITTPNTYVSEGKFLFATTGSETINLDPTRASETEVGTMASRATHVLTAERLLRRVVEKVTPEVILAPYEPEDEHSTGVGAVLHRIQRDWNAADVSNATVDDALLALRRRLSIDKPRSSDVLIATYVAHSRKLAQKVLDVYMKEAPKFHQESYDSPKVYEEMKKRAEAADAARATAQSAMRQFLEEEVRIQSGFEFELEQRRLREAESAADYAKNMRDVEGYRGQLTKLEQQLAATPATRQVSRQRDVTQIVTMLWERIVDLDKELLLTANEGVRRQLGEQRKTLETRIQEVQAAAIEAPPILVTEDNREFVSLQDEVARLQTDLFKAMAITQNLEQNHAADARHLGRLLDLEPRYRSLQEEVLRTHEIQKQAAAALAMAETKRQLQAGNFSSLNVIEDASLPLEKEGPNRAKLILGGLVLGLFFGLGVIVMRALPDSTVRDPADLERLDGMTVIGVLPRLDGRNVRRHEAMRARGG